MSVLSADGPRWFTIPAHRPFLDDLAQVLVADLAIGGPEVLADAVILTPTRRGARALADAFTAHAGGGAVLLPQILALGDLDEGEPPFEPGDLALDLPPAISPSRRRYELAQVVLDHAHLFDHPLDGAAALDLGDALGGFIDAVQLEEIDPRGKLDGLVVGDLAAHWLRSLHVLSLALEEWPRRLERLGLLDVTQRRTRLLRALADQWAARPPNRPLVAAGSTGTAPATANLLKVVAAAPLGAVVLPGLDLDLEPRAWSLVSDDHPQGSLKRLLDTAGVERAAVRLWPYGEAPDAAAAGAARRRIVNEALRPAEATDDWLKVIADLGGEAGDPAGGLVRKGLSGLSRLVARHEEEAASFIALLLRETLERPGATAALVTPDPVLARRVSARLSRWGVRADSSAGRPLADHREGAFLGLLVRLAAGPLEPAVGLALIKHPLARHGLDAPRRRSGARALERYGLRGSRPRDWSHVRRRLDAARRPPGEAGDDDERAGALEAASLIALRLEAAQVLVLEAFKDEGTTLADVAQALAAAAEHLGADECGDLGALWAGEGGEAAAVFLSELMQDGVALRGLTPSSAASVIDSLLAGALVRGGAPAHPRLKILGALEARLVSADRLILAGLEEGVWPRPPPVDPFLSRPMRQALKLPPPERRIGLAAHDFAQAASAPETVLVTCERRDGQPAVKSRWMWRLETLVKGAGGEIPRRRDVEAWARALDAPVDPRPETLRPAERPRPRPPLEVRPRRLPVTRVETWVRDPYAVYARHILRLRPLDRPDAALDASRRGTAIHKAFQRLADLAQRDPASADAERFSAFVLDALGEEGFSDAALTRERILAGRLGVWAADFEARRGGEADELLVEEEGVLEFLVDGRPFTLTAKADRIERIGRLGRVVDFKTGQPPTAEQVRSGFSPQLTLTGAILARGGFARLGALDPAALTYVHAVGRRTVAEEKSAVKQGVDPAELCDAAFDGLRRRIALFDNPETPYASWSAPQFLGARSGDYDRLARLYEWHVTGEGAEEEPPAE